MGRATLFQHRYSSTLLFSPSRWCKLGPLLLPTALLVGWRCKGILDLAEIQGSSGKWRFRSISWPGTRKGQTRRREGDRLVLWWIEAGGRRALLPPNYRAISPSYVQICDWTLSRAPSSMWRRACSSRVPHCFATAASNTCLRIRWWWCHIDLFFAWWERWSHDWLLNCTCCASAKWFYWGSTHQVACRPLPGYL